MLIIFVQGHLDQIHDAQSEKNTQDPIDAESETINEIQFANFSQYTTEDFFHRPIHRQIREKMLTNYIVSNSFDSHVPGNSGYFVDGDIKRSFKLDSLHFISTVDNCVKLSANDLPKFSHALVEQDFDSILMEIVEKLILFLTRFIKKLFKLKSMQTKSFCPTCSRSVYSPVGIPPDLEAMSGLFYLYCIECIEDSGDFSIIDINDEAKLSQIIFSLSSLIRNISYDLKLSKNYTQNAPLMTYLIAILNVDLDNAKNSVTALPESLTTLLIKVNFTFQNHTPVLKINLSFKIQCYGSKNKNHNMSNPSLI